MARGRRPRGSKDPFAALPTEFKDAMAAAQGAELQEKLAGITKSNEQNQAAKKADQDLKEKGAIYQQAGLPYKETAKLNSLKAKYIMRILADRGDADCQEFLKLNASKV